MGNCSENNSTDSYIGETGEELSKQIIDHSDRDKHSHLFKYANEPSHTSVGWNEFKILNEAFRSNIMKIKIIL